MFCIVFAVWGDIIDLELYLLMDLIGGCPCFFEKEIIYGKRKHTFEAL